MTNAKRQWSEENISEEKYYSEVYWSPNTMTHHRSNTYAAYLEGQLNIIGKTFSSTRVPFLRIYFVSGTEKCSCQLECVCVCTYCSMCGEVCFHSHIVGIHFQFGDWKASDYEFNHLSYTCINPFFGHLEARRCKHKTLLYISSP